MDSARNTFNIMKIRAAFQYALNMLLRHCNEKRHTLLGLIVGIRGEMLHWRPYPVTTNNDNSNGNYENRNEIPKITSNGTTDNNTNGIDNEKKYFKPSEFQEEHLFATSQYDSQIEMQDHYETSTKSDHLNKKKEIWKELTATITTRNVNV